MLRASTVPLIAAFLVGCATLQIDPARIEQAEMTGTCHVHRTQMTRERTRISYGLIAVPQGKVRDIELSKFPFAHRLVLGGCVIMTVEGSPELNSPTFADIYVCSRCDVAKVRWIRQNPDNPWAKMWSQQTPNK